MIRLGFLATTALLLQVASCSEIYQKVAAGVTAVPTDIQEGATIVILSYNNITTLPRDGFSASKNIKILNLQGNQISSILGYAFRGLDDLEELNLDQNRLRSLGDNKIWYELDSLKVLSLRDNNLYSIPYMADGRERYLSNLEQLDLGRNDIKEILKENPIRRYSNIVQLRLDGNKIETLPFGCFHELVNLKLLDLSDNRIREFPSLAVRHLRHLDILDVSKNSITQLPLVEESSMTLLRVLDVSSNRIKRISPRVLASFPNLDTLKMDAN